MPRRSLCAGAPTAALPRQHVASPPSSQNQESFCVPGEPASPASDQAPCRAVPWQRRLSSRGVDRVEPSPRRGEETVAIVITKTLGGPPGAGPFPHRVLTGRRDPRFL